MKKILSVLFVLKLISADPTPIVLWHGMGDTCCYDFSLGAFKQFLERHISGVYVISLRIGNSTVDDFENGYFMHPNKQVEYVCKLLAKDSRLANGFNAIGFSQGAQFLRGVVQRCGHKLPPIKNLISLGGQHQGVYGLPHCGALEHTTCDYVRKMLNYAAYYSGEGDLYILEMILFLSYVKFVLGLRGELCPNPSVLGVPLPTYGTINTFSWVQQSLVQATYWHDPLAENVYKKNSQYLADINNEGEINKVYIDNLNKLTNFVLVMFTDDSIVQPRETEWFGFYAPGQSQKLQTLQESYLYIEDRLGLKAMNESGRLHFLSSEGDHLHFTEDWFIEKILIPYLM